ncbi:lasso peptide biosynthesis PqqD family chaperone [Acidiluteibacter ferrifornacis]|uniref:lasso peptide biosynthesis PqqD family chaperone n=1 Tax=Acidiluteibacter ferrifornacis TaxID=2692424 RepID=UPI001A96A35C|nr:lasso peptide biosynthesis PqqD family chaperone [Acidiluteibacter ferrifornacis]
MNITIENTIERSNEVIASEVENELVMMSLENGKYYGMDSIGGDIWKMIESPIVISDICSRLMKEYNVDELTCKRDVLDFLDQLEEQRLVKIS